MRRSFLILALTALSSFAAQAAQEIDLSKYEREIGEQVRSMPVEKRFYLYLFAGRELLDWKIYSSAEKYLKLAVEQDVQEDKSEAYVRLLQLSYLRRDQKEAGVWLDQLDGYWKKREEKGHKNHKGMDVADYYRAWARPNDPPRLATETVPGSGLDLSLGKAEHYRLFRAGHYRQALSNLNLTRVMSSNSLELQAEYDLLNLLVNKNVSKLTCDGLWKKYKGSYSYGVLICGILNEHKVSGKVPTAKLEELNDYFETFDEDMQFLAEAVKKISS